MYNSGMFNHIGISVQLDPHTSAYVVVQRVSIWSLADDYRMIHDWSCTLLTEKQEQKPLLDNSRLGISQHKVGSRSPKAKVLGPSNRHKGSRRLCFSRGLAGEKRHHCNISFI